MYVNQSDTYLISASRDVLNVYIMKRLNTGCFVFNYVLFCEDIQKLYITLDNICLLNKLIFHM